MNDLDPSAIVRGAVLAAAIALPAAVISNLVDERSSLRSLLFLVTAGAFALGGWRAGREHPDRALTHGGLAGLAGYVAVLIVSILVRTARGATVSLATVPLPLFISVSCGVLGGYLAFRQSLGEPDEPGAVEAGP
jgi:putative membrane protein (TIGR04086 family)